MDIQEEIRSWQEGECVGTMERMGIYAGNCVVDYGCGIGNYTFPLSMVVQETGTVYAVDIDSHALKTVQKRAEAENIHNVHLMRPDRAGRVELPDNSADGFFIYDLIHMLNQEQILSESHRILKNGAILSILPFHMGSGQIRNLIRVVEVHGFELDNTQKSAGIHFEMHRFLNRRSERLKDYERGDIYNFRKL